MIMRAPLALVAVLGFAGAAFAASLTLQLNVTGSNAPWTPVFDQMIDFEGGTVGQQVDLPAMQQLFGGPGAAIATFQSWNYVYKAGNTAGVAAGTPCIVNSNGHNAAGGPATDCAPGTPLYTIVADGQSGKGMQNVQKVGYIGYQSNGVGSDELDFSFGGPAFNILDVEWDELWRSGFDLHQSPCGICVKVGLIAWFKRVGQPIYYGPTNEINWTNNLPAGTARLFMYNEGDGGTSPPHAVNENAFILQTPLALGQWHHFHFQIALGPSGWYKAWVDNTLYNQYPPGAVPGVPLYGGPWTFYQVSTTDAIGTGNPAEFTLRGFMIAPHFGGQSGDVPKNDSFIVYDNIHFRGYNR